MGEGRGRVSQNRAKCNCLECAAGF